VIFKSCLAKAVFLFVDFEGLWDVFEDPTFYLKKHPLESLCILMKGKLSIAP